MNRSLIFAALVSIVLSSYTVFFTTMWASTYNGGNLSLQSQLEVINSKTPVIRIQMQENGGAGMKKKRRNPFL